MSGNGVARRLVLLAGLLVHQGAAGQDGVWSAISPPTSRTQHAAIYDPVRDRMVIFGGNYLNVASRDLWALNLSGTPTWESLNPSIAPIDSRWSHSAIYDPLRDRMVIFGGAAGTTTFQDVWVVGLSSLAWSQLSPSGTPPSARSEHSAIYDPVGDRVIVYGGTSGSTQVWALSLAGTPTWAQLTPAGTPPPGREGHTAVYDASGDRMIVFGG